MINNVNYIIFKKHLFLIFSFTYSINFFSQNDSFEPDKFKSLSDSSILILTKDDLKGCWKSKNYQFKIDETNFGFEYKSNTISTSPLLVLKVISGEPFIEWYEVSGSYKQKIIWIKKNKLKLENETGKNIIFKRNKNCL